MKSPLFTWVVRQSVTFNSTNFQLNFGQFIMGFPISKNFFWAEMTKISKKSENRPSLSTQDVLSWWRCIFYGLKAKWHPLPWKTTVTFNSIFASVPPPKKIKYISIPCFFPLFSCLLSLCFFKSMKCLVGGGCVPLSVRGCCPSMLFSHQLKPLVILTQFFQLKN